MIQLPKNSRFLNLAPFALVATLTPLFAGTNVTLETPLQFVVAASTTDLARIELFSTGGSVGAVTNQPSAVFAVPPARLGVGLHPFYALVTDTTGNRYRTETEWIRLIPSIKLSITGPPLTLTWQAIPGRQYDILATTDLSAAFQPVASVVASNSIAQWPIPAPDGGVGFYRVLLAP